MKIFLLSAIAVSFFLSASVHAENKSPCRLKAEELQKEIWNYPKSDNLNIYGVNDTDANTIIHAKSAEKSTRVSDAFYNGHATMKGWKPPSTHDPIYGARVEVSDKKDGSTSLTRKGFINDDQMSSSFHYFHRADDIKINLKPNGAGCVLDSLEVYQPKYVKFTDAHCAIVRDYVGKKSLDDVINTAIKDFKLNGTFYNSVMRLVNNCRGKGALKDLVPLGPGQSIMGKKGVRYIDEPESQNSSSAHSAE